MNRRVNSSFYLPLIGRGSPDFLGELRTILMTESRLKKRELDICYLQSRFRVFYA